MFFLPRILPWRRIDSPTAVVRPVCPVPHHGAWVQCNSETPQKDSHRFSREGGKSRLVGQLWKGRDWVPRSIDALVIEQRRRSPCCRAFRDDCQTHATHSRFHASLGNAGPSSRTLGAGIHTRRGAEGSPNGQVDSTPKANGMRPGQSSWRHCAKIGVEDGGTADEEQVEEATALFHPCWSVNVSPTQSSQ